MRKVKRLAGGSEALKYTRTSRRDSYYDRVPFRWHVILHQMNPGDLLKGLNKNSVHYMHIGSARTEEDLKTLVDDVKKIMKTNPLVVGYHIERVPKGEGRPWK